MGQQAWLSKAGPLSLWLSPHQSQSINFQRWLCSLLARTFSLAPNADKLRVALLSSIPCCTGFPQGFECRGQSGVGGWIGISLSLLHHLERPTDLCSLRYDIILNLEMFHIIGSPEAKARGQNVTIFYFNRLSCYPWTSQEVPVNGGLPQNFSLQTYPEKAGCNINYYTPAKHFSALAITDWYYWGPQWPCDWDVKDIYRRKSRKLITKMEGNISAKDVEHLARVSFEKGAKAFMKETIALRMEGRPTGLWGYLYPDCHDYNFRDQNYTGSCSKGEVLRKNELSWLWDSSAVLYPSSAIKKSLGNSQNIFHFSQFRVNESIRISSMTSQDYALPIFVYTELDYRDEALLFLSTESFCWNNQDLINTIGEHALGATGIVIWDRNLTSSELSLMTQVKFSDCACLGNSASHCWLPGLCFLNGSESLPVLRCCGQEPRQLGKQHSNNINKPNSSVRLAWLRRDREAEIQPVYTGREQKAEDEGDGAVSVGCSRRDGQSCVTAALAMPSQKGTVPWNGKPQERQGQKGIKCVPGSGREVFEPLLSNNRQDMEDKASRPEMSHMHEKLWTL
ncbi:LOW QUALITY PROTEIN: hyaluronidase-4-like [Rhynochetos jubatus]